MSKRYMKARRMTLEIKVAGHPKNSLQVDPFSTCGEIKDGVSFAHGTGIQWEGGWVISFADLERIYRIAKAVRTEV